MPQFTPEIADLLRRIDAGQDVMIEHGDAAGLLDAAEAALAGRASVIRVRAGAPGLGLSGFMAQVAGGSDGLAEDDALLEQGYRRLAQDGAGRTVLLVSGAGGLQRPVLRFIQHVSRSAKGLVLVMAGEPGWAAVLDAPELAALRSRLLPAPDAVEPNEPTVAPPPRRARLGSGWALAGLGVAAGVLVGVWLGHQHWPGPGTQAALEAAPKQALAAAIGGAAVAAVAPTVAHDPAPVTEASAAVTPPPAPIPSPPAPSLAVPLPPLREPPAETVRRHAAVRRTEPPRQTRHAAARTLARPPADAAPEQYGQEPQYGWGQPDRVPYAGRGLGREEDGWSRGQHWPYQTPFDDEDD